MMFGEDSRFFSGTSGSSKAFIMNRVQQNIMEG